MKPYRDVAQEQVPFLDLLRQFEEIQDEVEDAIHSVIREASFIGGPFVRRFEEEFSRFQEVAHCVGVANGTDAIEIALEALAVDPGSEIIVPANSFIASSEAVTRAGLTVVFADVDESTLTIDPADVLNRISSRTSGILAVHLYGLPAEMTEIKSIADQEGLAVLEDAAQAHGARYRGQRVGGIGDIGTFSFYPGKNLGAYGDGGAVVSNREDLARLSRMIANHGRTTKYEHLFEGRNSRLDGLQAAILSVKLRYLDEWIGRRRALADRYRQGLEGVGDLVLPVEKEGRSHVYHLYVIRTESRDKLQTSLSESGIGTGIHYPVPLPRLKAYEDHPQSNEEFRAVRICQRLLSLPMGDGITQEQVDRVIDCVRGYFGE
jgi:dTDP-4-amino-4,6-dideoxygalactose transaminase